MTGEGVSVNLNLVSIVEIEGNRSLVCCASLFEIKIKTGEARPAARHTFARAAKVSKNAFS